jgi:trehalose 6-phosphate synthase
MVETPVKLAIAIDARPASKNKSPKRAPTHATTSLPTTPSPAKVDSVMNPTPHDTGRLVIASNRLPPRQRDSNGTASRLASVGGLVSALEPALMDHGGLWFGWSGSTEHPDALTASESVGPITFSAVDISADEEALYYNGFSNRTLWPLLHGFSPKAEIDRSSYVAYRDTNRRLAERLVAELGSDDLLWVQDYHLIPLGLELRRLGWMGKMGWFLHTPFPPAETFAVLPWAAELLEALTHYALIGLHTKRYVRNLYDSLGGELPRGSVLGNAFAVSGRIAKIGAYPVGIDPSLFEGTSPPEDSSVLDLFSDLDEDHQILLGVDRLDYTKGIPLRLLAFERFLDNHPELHGKVTLVQVAVPSREGVQEYEDERNHVDQLVGRINGRFSELHWAPIRYLYRSYPREDLRAFYHRARVCMVTPLADGMNLVAKEYVASQTADDPGTLILSKFCGAAETMRDALIVNPYDTDSCADALYLGLTMPVSQRRARRENLMLGVREFTATQWSNTFVNDLRATTP